MKNKAESMKNKVELAMKAMFNTDWGNKEQPSSEYEAARKKFNTTYEQWMIERALNKDKFALSLGYTVHDHEAWLFGNKYDKK